MDVTDEKIKLLEAEVNDERQRLSTDRLDISFGELINLYKNKELIIRPEYQRLFRWSNSQKTALIESILLSIPIPPIFVAEDDNGVWELVDGLQRVSTFLSFFGELENSVEEINNFSENDDLPEELEDEPYEPIEIGNRWKLEKGGLIENLEDFDVDTLPSKFKINLKRAVCRVEILRGESSTSMKYELFKRLNSGGSKLTPQEIRNAIYRGINPTLNVILLRISQTVIFKRLTQLSKLKIRELYDQELVLRFFAFYENAGNITDNTENFLNKFMEGTVKDPGFDYNGYETLFMEVLELIGSLGDDKVFRNHMNLFVPAYFEGIVIGVSQNISRFRNNTALMKEKIDSLKTDNTFKRYSGTASNSRSRIRLRLGRANELFEN